MQQHDTDNDTSENAGFHGGASGTRTRDLRIKRPSAKTHIGSGKTEVASGCQSATRNTCGTLETGSSTPGLKIGARVRITAGSAAGVVGVVVAEYVPLKPKSWRLWTVRTDDLVGRREIRQEFLEVVP